MVSFISWPTLSIASGGALAADKIKVALVIANKLGDASFYDSANAGLERAKKELDIVGKVVECNFDPANYVPYLATAAKNFDLVLVVGFEFIDAIEQVAPEFPTQISPISTFLAKQSMSLT